MRSCQIEARQPNRRVEWEVHDDRLRVGACAMSMGGDAEAVASAVRRARRPHLIGGVDRAADLVLVVRTTGRRGRTRLIVDVGGVDGLRLVTTNTDGDGGPSAVAGGPDHHRVAAHVVAELGASGERLEGPRGDLDSSMVGRGWAFASVAVPVMVRAAVAARMGMSAFTVGPF